ncbi:MAG: hypothetical protein LBT76_01065, partial [Tannerella sp.]|nr:hypothetical protein [Tannerella sp.]
IALDCFTAFARTECGVSFGIPVTAWQNPVWRNRHEGQRLRRSIGIQTLPVFHGVSKKVAH